jgi:hypothetical protein
MKTNDLIAALSADTKSVSPPITRTLWLAAAVGAVGAAVLFFLLLGPRGDLGAALENPRLMFKWLLTLSLLASAMGLAMQLARPESVPGVRFLVLVVTPVVLAVGIAAELMALPRADWESHMIGTSPMACVVLIPILSALPLAALIYAMRQGAPARPILAGAVARLAAAGLAGPFYCSHCLNDSPLFVAVWYGIAIAIVATLGALLGGRLLRW